MTLSRRVRTAVLYVLALAAVLAASVPFYVRSTVRVVVDVSMPSLLRMPVMYAEDQHGGFKFFRTFSVKYPQKIAFNLPVEQLHAVHLLFKTYGRTDIQVGILQVEGQTKRVLEPAAGQRHIPVGKTFTYRNIGVKGVKRFYPTFFLLDAFLASLLFWGLVKSRTARVAAAATSGYVAFSVFTKTNPTETDMFAGMWMFALFCLFFDRAFRKKGAVFWPAAGGVLTACAVGARLLFIRSALPEDVHYLLIIMLCAAGCGCVFAGLARVFPAALRTGGGIKPDGTAWAALAAAVAGTVAFSFYFNANILLNSLFFTVFAASGLFCVYLPLLRARPPVNRAAAVFSIVFAVLHLCPPLFDGSADGRPTTAAIACIGEAAMAYVAVQFLLSRFDRWRDAPPENPAGRFAAFYDRHTFWVSGALLLVLWTAFARFFALGRVSLDMVSQLELTQGTALASQHHPFVSTFLMTVCFEAGTALKDNRTGLLLYIFLQDAVCAAAFAACLERIRRFGMPAAYRAGAFLFFAFVPFGVFAVWGIKDVLYSGFFTLFVLQTMTLFIKGEREPKAAWFAGYALTALAVCLTRNNGIHVVAPTLAAAAVFTRRKASLAAVLAFAAGVYFFLTQSVFVDLGYVAGSKREALSLPFQQTALYVKKHGDEVTPDEYRAINRVLSVRALPELYEERSSDPVKRTYKPDFRRTETRDLKNYFAAWARMFFKHPMTYVHAFFNASSQYLSFVPYQVSLPSRINFRTEWLDTDELTRMSAVENAADMLLYTFLWAFPYLAMLFSCAFYVNLTVLCALYVRSRKRPVDLTPLLPSAISILVCVASPVNGLLRYAMPVIAVMPLVAAYVARGGKENAFLLDK